MQLNYRQKPPTAQGQCIDQKQHTGNTLAAANVPVGQPPLAWSQVAGPFALAASGSFLPCFLSLLCVVAGSTQSPNTVVITMVVGILAAPDGLDMSDLCPHLQEVAMAIGTVGWEKVLVHCCVSKGSLLTRNKVV